MDEVGPEVTGLRTRAALKTLLEPLPRQRKTWWQVRRVMQRLTMWEGVCSRQQNGQTQKARLKKPDCLRRVRQKMERALIT